MPGRCVFDRRTRLQLSELGECVLDVSEQTEERLKEYLRRSGSSGGSPERSYEGAPALMPSTGRCPPRAMWDPIDADVCHEPPLPSLM